MDCIASVVTDILQSFGQAQGTFALALDLMETFNAVLPGILICQLIGMGASGLIVNFVNFIDISIESLSKPPDYGSWATGFPGAISAWSHT